MRIIKHMIYYFLLFLIVLALVMIDQDLQKVADFVERLA